jgi:hypothetical protein
MSQLASTAEIPRPAPQRSGRSVTVKTEQDKHRYTTQNKKIEPGEVLDNRGHRTILLIAERNTGVFCSCRRICASILLAAPQYREWLHRIILIMLK